MHRSTVPAVAELPIIAGSVVARAGTSRTLASTELDGAFPRFTLCEDSRVQRKALVHQPVSKKDAIELGLWLTR